MRIAPTTKKKISHAFLSLAVLAIITVTLNGILISSSQAQPTEQLMQQVAQHDSAQDGKESSAASSSDSTDSESNNNESSDESSPSINLSESIPINEALEVWEDKFSALLATVGLDNSIHARLVASVLIAVIALSLMLIANRLTKKLRQNITHLARRVHLSKSKTRFYQRAILWLANFLLFVGAISAIAVTWGADIETLFNEWVMAALANILTVYFIVLGGTILVHIADGLVERMFKRWGSRSQSRTNTLLPIARNTVYVTCFIIFTLMLLAELGINVMPLLAGAGVLGFAIGFGAQTLIKDLLMGFIIIFEDLIQVDDVVTLAGRTGIVERISIRKVQLRDLSGNVYTVPFSEVDIVENKTKDFSYAMLEIGVAYREDIDEVMKMLVEVDKQLQADDDFKDVLLEPLEMFGLDKFGDSAIVIKARIKTIPLQQWNVLREFNRRVKILFDDRNVEIPFPHQTIYFGEDKNGSAPPLQFKPVDSVEHHIDDAAVNSDKPTSNQQLHKIKDGGKQPAPEGDDGEL